MLINNSTLQALRTGFNTNFQAGLGAAADITEPFITIVPSTTKLETYGFLGDFPIFRKWVGAKRLKSMEEKAYQLANDDYEVSIEVHKFKIMDDNLGLYGPIMTGIGTDAGRLRPRLVLDALKNGHLSVPASLCYDGLPFFSNAHVVNGVTFSNSDTTAAVNPWYLMDLRHPLKPIIYQNRMSPIFVSNVNGNGNNDHLFDTGMYKFGGEARGAAGYSYWQTCYRSTATLNAANYEAAKQAMASITDDNGEPLGLVPTHIVIGATNKAAAKTLFSIQNNAAGAGNIYYQDVEIIDGSLRLS